MKMYTRVWAPIDLDAVVYNMESMKKNLNPGTEMVGVVKTDGYGHGAVPIAKVIDPFVAGYAVATPEEALCTSPSRDCKVDSRSWSLP